MAKTMVSHVNTKDIDLWFSSGEFNVVFTEEKAPVWVKKVFGDDMGLRIAKVLYGTKVIRLRSDSPDYVIAEEVNWRNGRFIPISIECASDGSASRLRSYVNALEKAGMRMHGATKADLERFLAA